MDSTSHGPLVFGDFMNQQLKALNLFYVASWHFMLMTCWGCGNPNSETYHKAEAEAQAVFQLQNLAEGPSNTVPI